MSSTAEKFSAESAAQAFNLPKRDVLQENLQTQENAIGLGTYQLANLATAKRKAHVIKWRAIENLDKLLPEFEANFQRRGGKVIWANDAEEARQEILNIIQRVDAKTVIQSRNIVTSEIDLKPALQNEQVELLSANIGEFIVDLLGQKPTHLVKPGMHLSAETIAQLFHERFGLPAQATPEQITKKARELLRNKFIQADVGITGADFLITDTGSIALSENEGDARLTTSFPKIHIAIAGIEKLVPSLTDLDLFWPMLATHSTGQGLMRYNTIISGPRRATETDGPDEMYIILLDNGRTNLLAQKEQRQGLYCIQCGACLNVCPVYQTIGGAVYNTTYNGPIGSVITPHTQGMDEFKHLSYASTLCGACTEVCPVKIDLHKMLLLNRRDAVKENLVPKKEVWGWTAWKRVMQSRKLTDFLGTGIKNFFLKTFFKDSWGQRRELPQVAEKSFAQRWAEQKSQPED
ncbi:lactate utilization protein [Mucilaginibacter robiniae]|uniref:Lactate utilization protein n=1 Tax=Mucilaginibacter robiniae TaxID=2728022 RepID=A0A7L5E6K6_9SPHI|nr:lactate utilization protein B [Mucilaginibacter robiniae]QJD96473.1 lactate utilization protein [Mucilaginibacter robiniae]